MNIFRLVRSRFSFTGRYHFRWVLVISVCWTIIDLIWIGYFHSPNNLPGETPFQFVSIETVLLRGCIVFFTSYLIGYILFFKLRGAFRNLSLLANLLAKTGVLLLFSLLMNFLLHFTNLVFLSHLSVSSGLQVFFSEASSVTWLLRHSIGWVVLFLATQMTIEFYEKYSPGVFWQILIGRYIQPKVERRIVMFLDLTDSTPIAEQLGSKQYFRFLRDFIYFLSVALLEYDGRIYQYIGDEIVVSWKHTRGNTIKCLDAVAISFKLLQKNSSYFQARYGIVPRFNAGIHVGEVTVGEIGIVKKDVVMSGDTMNTAARICDYGKSLTTTKCVVSKDFLMSAVVSWETESLGTVDLKGKNEGVELYAIKI